MRHGGIDSPTPLHLPTHASPLAVGHHYPQVAGIGATLLAEVLPRWIAGSLSETPQDEALVTYAPKLARA
ncbi:MAG: hypothetical protein ACTS5I_15715, partial [Rhodanobacter sp.]